MSLQRESLRVAGKIKNYFASGNTARGFYSLFDSNLQGLDRLFILKGGPGTGKSSLMKEIGNAWVEDGYEVEFMHSPSNNNSVDGLLIPALKVGIVDGTAPHIIEPKAPGAVEEYINLGVAWNAQALKFQKSSILRLTSQISDSYRQANSCLKEALSFHDEWEELYLNQMDTKRADRLTAKLIEMFFGKMRVNKQAEVRHRFLGAITPDGTVDFIPNLTEEIPKRYFMKGRPELGKSAMLKKMAEAAVERGFDVEIYHCGFDPQNHDMVVFRELGICIFDSIAPHEYFPSRDGDEIIDMYELLIAPGTDEMFAEQMIKFSTSYKGKIAEATSHLVQVKQLNDRLKSIYSSAMDFSIVDQIRDRISAEMKELAEIHP